MRNMSGQLEQELDYAIAHNQKYSNISLAVGAAALALGVGIGVADLTNGGKVNANIISVDAASFAFAGAGFSLARTFGNRANVLLAELLASGRMSVSPTDITTPPVS